MVAEQDALDFCNGTIDGVHMPGTGCLPALRFDE